MKKPRKPKTKRAHAGKHVCGAMPSARACAVQPSRKAPPKPVAQPAIAMVRVATTSWSDEREKLALLLLPFFIMAFALGLSHTLKQTPRLGEIVATAPLPAILKSVPRPADPLANAPSLGLPRQAPVVAAPTVNEALPRTAVLELPHLAPTIERPELRVPGAISLPIAPPVIEMPVVAIAAPAIRLPVAPPQVMAPAAPPVQIALAPIAKPPVSLPPITQSRSPTRPDICVTSPTLGRHVYPAVAQTEAAQSDSAESFGQRVAAAAVAQTEEFVIYNDKYRRIAFPMGDVPTLFGVCTDVVIRAYRAAGVDLQELVHRSRVGSGDYSIAHRRTETLRQFFARHGRSLPVSPFAEDYQPGDIVTYERPQNRRSRSHVAIVSDRIAPSGRPMIVHNRGWGPQLEDGLFVDRITGHYRFAPIRSAPVLEAGRPTLRRPSAAQSRPLVKASYVAATTAR